MRSTLNRPSTTFRRLLAPLLCFLATSGVAAQGADDATLQRVMVEILPRVEALSGLEARRPLNVAARSRADFIQYLEVLVREDAEERDLASLSTVYSMLGLLPEAVDLSELSISLLAERIGGYFDPRRDSLFVMMDIPESRLRSILAHEMVHALQHQYTPLDVLVAAERGGDRQTAARAAIEGHAALVEAMFGLEEATGRPVAFTELPDLTRAPLEFFLGDDPLPIHAAAPPILRDGMVFPYVRGAGFVQSLWRRDRNAVPFLAFLPQSTEQIIDPEARFFDSLDPPTEIVFLDAPAQGELTAAAGRRAAADADPAWTVEYENTLGQFELSILLRDRHRLHGSERYALGWAGDRYRLLFDGERHLVLWYLVWDDARAAFNFANAYRQILGQRLGRGGWVEELTVDGRSVVRIVEAPEGVDPETVPRPEFRLSSERN
jgi:hypothetical protein